MQASPTSARSWTPPSGTLGRLVAEAEARVAALRPRRDELERQALAAAVAPSMSASLLGRSVGVIAEVKRRSPSKGDIAPGLGASAQAAAYAAGGAAALSILTEPAHFGGRDADLAEARAAVVLPLLKKDFHVHPLQMVQARALGASAALVIARAVSPARLGELARAAADVGLEVLFEVLETVLEAGALMIGVNNRDLETLVIDPDTAVRLLPLVPADRIAIAESGVRTRADVERYARAGADAVLVGSSISASSEPATAVRALADVSRAGRGG